MGRGRIEDGKEEKQRRESGRERGGRIQLHSQLTTAIQYSKEFRHNGDCNNALANLKKNAVSSQNR